MSLSLSIYGKCPKISNLFISILFLLTFYVGFTKYLVELQTLLTQSDVDLHWFAYANLSEKLVFEMLTLALLNPDIPCKALQTE